MLITVEQIGLGIGAVVAGVLFVLNKIGVITLGSTKKYDMDKCLAMHKEISVNLEALNKANVLMAQIVEQHEKKLEKLEEADKDIYDKLNKNTTAIAVLERT